MSPAPNLSPSRPDAVHLSFLKQFLVGKSFSSKQKLQPADEPVTPQAAAKPAPQIRHYLLLACFPKSGSTYLSAVLANLPGFSKVQLVSVYGKREQEIEPALIALNADRNYVAQHHVRYSEATAELIRQFSLKPIVLVRNIFDAIISFRDHIRNESVLFPMAYASPCCVAWDDERLETFIADMIAPWYFNFFASWSEAPEKLLLRYEDLQSNPHAVLRCARSHFNIACTDKDIEAAILAAQSQATRKNKAINGRGQSLSENARLHIHRLASYYDGLDLTPMGL